MIAQDTLKTVPLFTGLKPAALAVLARCAQERRYRSGQALFRAGDVATALYVVLDGHVRVVRSTLARGQVVHTEGRGGTLGEIPLFTGESFPATATATEPLRCVVVPKAAVEAAIAADPALALRLLAGLSTRVRRLIERLDRLVFAGVRARLAAWILERAERTVGATISLGLTQTALAEELGTVREVVVRELRALRAAGLIEPRGSGRLAVTDRDGLLAMVRGEPMPGTSGASEPARAFSRPRPPG